MAVLDNPVSAWRIVKRLATARARETQWASKRLQLLDRFGLVRDTAMINTVPTHCTACQSPDLVILGQDQTHFCAICRACDTEHFVMIDPGVDW